MRQCVAMHRGQRISKRGTVTGKPVATSTFGLRWQAFHNLFASAGDIGEEEWRAKYEEADDDDAERALCQFTHAIPYRSPNLDRRGLHYRDVMRRADNVRRLGKGTCPVDTGVVAIGADIGKRLLHWFAVHRTTTGDVVRHHGIDYGIVEVPSDALGVEQGLKVALAEFREQIVLAGFRTASDAVHGVDQVWVDARWQSEDQDESRPVYEFIREQDEEGLFRPALGCASSQYNRRRRYSQPNALTSVIRYIGRGYHFKWVANEALYVVDHNSDYWKGQVHDHVLSKSDTFTMYYSTDRFEHLTLGKHITAEIQEEEFVPGKGSVRVFRQVRRQNHYLDAAALAFGAAEYAAVAEELRES
jgi:hypothetical protein